MTLAAVAERWVSWTVPPRCTSSLSRSQVLKDHRPHDDGWPSQFKPRRLVGARRRFDEMIEERFDDPAVRSAFGPVLQRSEVPDGVLAEMEDYLDAILGANL